MRHAEYTFREEFQPIDSQIFYDDGRPQNWKEILEQDQLDNPTDFDQDADQPNFDDIPF